MGTENHWVQVKQKLINFIKLSNNVSAQLLKQILN